MVDDPCTEVYPLTSNKHSGFNSETQVEMELSYDRGHSGGRGSTQCLPSSGLDGEVEECVGGRKAPLRNEWTNAK